MHGLAQEGEIRVQENCEKEKKEEVVGFLEGRALEGGGTCESGTQE